MGHDGPGHIAIAEGKTKVRPLGVYHGKVGKGLSVEMQVKHGPVTLLSVVEKKGGGLMLLVAEGESVPGPILQIGNTNSRYKFSIGARKFVNDWNSRGPAHHCAVGIGHVSSKIEKLGALLGMEVCINVQHSAIIVAHTTEAIVEHTICHLCCFNPFCYFSPTFRIIV